MPTVVHGHARQRARGMGALRAKRRVALRKVKGSYGYVLYPSILEMGSMFSRPKGFGRGVLPYHRVNGGSCLSFIYLCLRAKIHTMHACFHGQNRSWYSFNKIGLLGDTHSTPNVTPLQRHMSTSMRLAVLFATLATAFAVPPLIIVPGLGGSVLEAKLHNVAPNRGARSARARVCNVCCIAVCGGGGWV